MAEYRLTEKGIAEARKKRTTLKGMGEAVTFGGPWKGEDYSNVLLISLLQHNVESGSRRGQDVYEIQRMAFNKPRPSPTKVARTLGYLVGKGYVKVIPAGRSISGYSDVSGQRLSRRSHKGWKRNRF